MNPIDGQLNRLFRAAARADGLDPARAGLSPAAIENRVMAGWRDGMSAASVDWVIKLFRRAAICACAIMLLSLAWTFRHPAPSANDELLLADSATQTALMQ